jgi:hypothetical protein
MVKLVSTPELKRLLTLISIPPDLIESNEKEDAHISQNPDWNFLMIFSESDGKLITRICGSDLSVMKNIKTILSRYCFPDIDCTQIQFGYVGRLDAPEATLLDDSPWVETLNCSDVNESGRIEECDILLLTLHPKTRHELNLIRRSYPEVFIIGLPPCGVLSFNLDYQSSAEDFLSGLMQLDAILVSTALEESFFSYFHSRILRVTYPFPFHRFQAYLGLQKCNRIGINAMTKSAIKNLSTICRLFEIIQEIQPTLDALILRSSIDFESEHLIKKGEIDVVHRSSKEWYPIYLAGCQLVINPSMEPILERLPLECAFFGIPCIGPDNQEMQRWLWPNISVPIYDLNSIVSCAQRLLADKEFYQKNIVLAAETLKDLLGKNHKKNLITGLRHFFSQRITEGE